VIHGKQGPVYVLSAVERKIEQFIADLNDKEVSGLYAQLPNGKRLRAKLILKIAGSNKRLLSLR